MNEKKRFFLIGTVLGIIFGVFIFVSTYLFLDNSYQKNVEVNSISYQVNFDSAINEAINKASPNVVGVVRFKDNVESGTGSGVIYKLNDDHAYIVTNKHVIDKGTKVEVAFQSKERVEAKVLGSDIITDIAILEIPRGDLNGNMDFADSSNLKVGELVFAIGNPLGLKFYGSATLGIVSSIERLLPIDIDKDGEGDWFANVIQTDAAINPGNSGGALVNVAGDLVGINSMKISNEQVEGIGFAIPSNIVYKIVNDLEMYGDVKRPYLGIHPVNMKQLSEQDRSDLGLHYLNSGVYVNDVSNISCGYKYGIRIHDVITKVGDEKVESVTDLRLKLYEHKIGEEVSFSIIRNNTLKIIKVTLEAKK